MLILLRKVSPLCGFYQSGCTRPTCTFLRKERKLRPVWQLLKKERNQQHGFTTDRERKLQMVERRKVTACTFFRKKRQLQLVWNLRKNTKQPTKQPMAKKARPFGQLKLVLEEEIIEPCCMKNTIMIVRKRKWKMF